MESLTMRYGRVPTILKRQKQWVLWKYVERDGKKTKVPFQVDGRPASSTSTSSWATFKQAVDASAGYEGIGFVFWENDDFIGVDLDGCIDPQGKLQQWAKDVVLKLGSYAERSPSGTGVKIFGTSAVRWPHRNKVDLPFEAVSEKSPGIEVYSAGRFFCVTGLRLKDMIDVAPIEAHFDWLGDTYAMRHEQTIVTGDGIKFETPLLERASKYLAKMEPSISGSGGHNKCFHAACTLVMGFGLSTEEAFRLLRVEFNPRCNPEWSERELRHKVEQAAKQPGPRGYLADAKPEDYAKIRLPSNYRESSRDDHGFDVHSPIRETTLKDAAKQYLNQLADGGQHLAATGIPSLDEAIGGGVAKGEMVIVAARPSHGKSCVALQMAHQFSVDGRPVVVISEEMSAIAMGKRAVQFATGYSESDWQGSIAGVRQDVDWHFENRQDVVVVEGCGSVENAISVIERHVKEKNAMVAIVDYAQILQAKGKDATERSSVVSSRLKQLATRLNIIVVVLAQLNREIENRKVFRPQMSDLKQTGQLEQDADVIVFGVWPHRIDASQNPDAYQFYIAKNRNREIKNAAFECQFLPSRQMLLAKPVSSHENYESSFEHWAN